MKKVFISQPMNSRTDNEILAERQEIIEMAKEDLGEIEVIDSFPFFRGSNPCFCPNCGARVLK